MTLAIASAFTLRKGAWHEEDFQSFVVSRMVDVAKEYKDRRWWGENFYKWFMGDQKPYNSYGNGSAMRVSSVGWIAESEEEVKHFSRLVTEVSHNHPEGLKGAEAVAMAIYLGRTGHPMDEIRKRMEAYYPQISSMTVDKIRPSCEIDTQGKFITCQVSVPQAIVCFLEATSFEDAVRNAISLGGDADTQAAIAGSMAEAYFGVPYELEDEAIEFLPSNLKSIYFAFDTVKKKRGKRK
jgi:type I restriction enzyme M protein